MSKSKYYVVWKGHRPGVYSSWEDCKAQVFGYEGAVYKSYNDINSAQLAYTAGPSSFKSKNGNNKNNLLNQEIQANSICVDAACSGNPGEMEYRCVKTISKEEIFHKGPFKDGTNNIGEFLALVHALALLDKKGRYDIVIYTDSITAMAWVRNKKAKSTLELTTENAILFDMIQKAETWLKTHSVKNPIEKWQTEVWGEIPADFGRK
jgi:ribonuclease HI